MGCRKNLLTGHIAVPDEPSVVVTNYCEWSLVSWTLELRSAVRQEVTAMPKYATLSIEALIFDFIQETVCCCVCMLL